MSKSGEKDIEGGNTRWECERGERKRGTGEVRGERRGERGERGSGNKEVRKRKDVKGENWKGG